VNAGTFLNAATGSTASNFGFGAAKIIGNVSANSLFWYGTAVAALIPDTGASYVAGAAAPIHPDFTAVGAGANLANGCDVWYITNTKTLIQFRRGY
jgi:hypothetical protein